jgi:hypothetical protein
MARATAASGGNHFPWHGLLSSIDKPQVVQQNPIANAEIYTKDEFPSFSYFAGAESKSDSLKIFVPISILLQLHAIFTFLSQLTLLQRELRPAISQRPQMQKHSSLPLDLSATQAEHPRRPGLKFIR